MEYYRKAERIIKKHHATNLKDSGYVFFNIGTVLEEMKDYENALEYYQKAFEVYKFHFGRDDQDTVIIRERIERVKKMGRKGKNTR
ncbi:MAG: tetratricopeptide repeat protein [Lachnospiraceae bacterium]|nr:tetratricopeptide repeat protein [Lachnospiraceae bacterium]